MKVSKRTIVASATGLGLVLGVSTVQATGYDLGDAANYVAIFQGGGGNQLNINNPSGLFNNTDTGNIGIAGTGKLQLSGPLTINGNIDFAASTAKVNDTSYIHGNVNAGVTQVQTDMNNLTALSAALGAEVGTSVALAAGKTINATAGVLDAMGNSVFTVSSINAPNGDLTINGDGSHNVVINISAAADANIHFNNIILTGGLTSDDVLFNIFGGMNLSGGPTLDLNSNGGTLNGIFLDPNGAISLVHTILQGRIFGGDSHDEQLVSGGTMIAPKTPPSVPDGGSTLALLGLALGGLGYMGRKLQARPALALIKK